MVRVVSHRVWRFGSVLIGCTQSETLKYLYLLFDDAKTLPLSGAPRLPDSLLIVLLTHLIFRIRIQHRGNHLCLLSLERQQF